jgi:NitT/TauT family transport system ATP-binding protein
MAPSIPATPMIDVAGLCKTYSTRDGPIVTLDAVSFSVAAQEFVSVLGPSGCGKTTVLKVIAGLVPASDGQVQIEGIRVTGSQRKIGIVLQVPALMRWRTAIRNVMLPAEILGLDPVHSRRRAPN